MVSSAVAPAAKYRNLRRQTFMAAFPIGCPAKLNYSAGARGGQPSVTRASPLLVLDVLRHAAHGGFRGEQIAGRIDGNPFSHRTRGRIGLVRRHEDGDLAVLQAADADALQPAR